MQRGDEEDTHAEKKLSAEIPCIRSAEMRQVLRFFEVLRSDRMISLYIFTALLSLSNVVRPHSKSILTQNARTKLPIEMRSGKSHFAMSKCIWRSEITCDALKPDDAIDFLMSNERL
jgi:hypothetical protein